MVKKYTAKDKLQAVERYLNGKESSYDIAKSMETDNKAILKWVKQYEYNGVEAFIQPYTNYTLEFKMDVLNFMIENGTSLNETAAIFKIPAPSTISVWRKQYEIQGLDALQSKKKGRPSMKKEFNKQSKQAPVEGSTEALEARIKQLEMENEYLKKLNALVQNKEKSPNRTKRK
ncbi:transposase [Lysinibacillus xylanilyticus]|uniref:Transposase n=1 Tax=Lysinibacillus xylanilyticus TaxID=582475 RepID=A0A0K9FBR9_9BACI|nr:transposase [Lysinibacillus xylanilyticus]KMY29922.1 transposase [Lysinibacillus xylanilyticus]KMY30332.1 transposase [Lysinibacillus xylanilyticus]KMY31673.1 transposase [Lysinibacillus xylanilyticus]KMY32891.1 transposase [Lysinibacillus xylanilyticus]